jgi:hypothetical protein
MNLECRRRRRGDLKLTRLRHAGARETWLSQRLSHSATQPFGHSVPQMQHGNFNRAACRHTLGRRRNTNHMSLAESRSVLHAVSDHIPPTASALRSQRIPWCPVSSRTNLTAVAMAMYQEEVRVPAPDRDCSHVLNVCHCSWACPPWPACQHDTTKSTFTVCL